MAKPSGGKVIYLQSHPAWVAARCREHAPPSDASPSLVSRPQRAASGGNYARDLGRHPGTDTPA